MNSLLGHRGGLPRRSGWLPPSFNRSPANAITHVWSNRRFPVILQVAGQPIQSYIMSSIAPSRTDTAPLETDPAEEKRLRAKARRRATFCPGAGWALLGYGRRGTVVFISFIVFATSLVWMLWALSTQSLYTLAATTLVAAIVWTAEWFDVGWCIVRPHRDHWLVRRFAIAAYATVATVIAVPLLTATRFVPLTLADDYMEPAIQPREQLIYHRGVRQQDFVDGAVVLWKMPARASIGKPGEIFVARILALPGDKISVRRGQYVVNGETTRYRAAPTVAAKTKAKVPRPPETLSVPEGRYFVVQDGPSGVDSQSLGWLQPGDALSTRLFHFGRGGILRPVR